MSGDPDTRGFGGGGGFLEAAAVGSVRVWLYLERGLRVASFEVLPLGQKAWEAALLTSHAPTSSSVRAARSGSEVILRETVKRLNSLHLICFCLNRKEW